MPINKRTYPSFSLIQTTSITLKRSQGSYVNGKWIDGIATSTTIEANVQPTPAKELALLPEADRTKEWITVYSVSEMRTAKEGSGGWTADLIVWKGNNYKVMKSQHWEMGTLDHYKAMASREPISAGY
jgi:hypothetical protein